MNVRRIAGVAAVGAAALLLAPSVAAQEAGQASTVTYGASASGQALRLSVFGEELTIGRTATGLDSALQATASGVGIATPLYEGGVSTASVSGEGVDGSVEEICEGSLEDIPGLSISLACSSSLAQVVGGVPGSVATGRVGDVVVNPVAPLLDTQLVAVVEPVEDGVGQLLEGLRPVSSAVDEATGLGLEDTLDDLFGALFGGADLLRLQLGSTVAENLVGPSAVSATCAAQGGRLDILDLPALADGVDPAPVMSIVIGSATTSVGVTTADAVPTAAVDPAIVTVIVPSLGIDQAVGPGERLEIPLPEPLGPSTIAVAGGATGVDENGQTFATADGVLLDLLNGEAMMGGIELSLANCTSLAGAVLPAQIPSATTVPPTPTLPRTGSTDSVALVGAIGLATAGLVLLRRRATGS